MVFHHGAGYSGLSFAMMAKEITTTTGGECGVLAMDCRRHGAPFFSFQKLIVSLTSNRRP